MSKNESILLHSSSIGLCIVSLLYISQKSLLCSQIYNRWFHMSLDIFRKTHKPYKQQNLSYKLNLSVFIIYPKVSVFPSNSKIRCFLVSIFKARLLHRGFLVECPFYAYVFSGGMSCKEPYDLYCLSLYWSDKICSE